MKEAERILLDLKRKIYKPVYFLFGDEPYFIDQISDFVESNVLTEDEKGFNQEIFYGKETNLSAVLSSARQYPMLSEYRVVIVREAQELKDFAKKADLEDDDEAPAGGTKQFIAYLDKPTPSTILVFCHKHKSFDKRTSLAKALQKKSEFLETKRYYDNQIPQWITGYASSNGYKINPRAAFIMGEFLGNSLQKIANEFDKLVISLDKNAEISEAMVRDKIGVSKDYNVFELQDALGNKDVLKANRIINYFAANEKEGPIVLVLSNLYGYFSKILRYHAAPDKSRGALAAALGVNPFFVEGYARAASNYPSRKLQRVFGYLKECDLRSKGISNNSTENGELLKELVFKILH